MTWAFMQGPGRHLVVNPISRLHALERPLRRGRWRLLQTWCHFSVASSQGPKNEAREYDRQTDDRFGQWFL